MTLKTSLLITGDAATAQKAVEDVRRGVEQLAAAGKASTAELGSAGKAAATALSGADRAQQAATASAGAMAQAQAGAAGAIRDVAGAAGSAGAALDAIGGSAGSAAGAVEGATDKIRKHTQAANDNEAAARRHAFGLRSLGQQFSDMAVMIQGGIDPMRAFATQAGQMGYALSEMGGKAGAVGAFLTGPWGIALTIAVTSLAPFISKLWESEQASKQAELATSHLGDAQSTVAELFGKASSKIAEQNELLRLNARIKAMSLRVEAAQDEKTAAKTFRQTGQPGLAGASVRALNTIYGLGGDHTLDALGIGTGSAGAMKLAERARAANKLADGAARERAFDAILKDSEKVDFAGSGIDRAAFREAVSKAAGARLNRRLADLIDKSLDARAIDPLLRKPEHEKSARKPKSADALGEFGRDTADRIAAIGERFDRTPPIVRQIDQANRELADLMDDLQRRKPPGFEKLIADAREAGKAIEAGLNRPLAEFLDGQRQQLEQGALILAGRHTEAEALRAIVAIERQRGPLSAQQRAEVVASVAALKQQERQLERIHAVQQINLTALEDMRRIVAQTIYEGPKSLAQLPARVFESFKRFAAERIAEEWFGELFRDARDKITGANKVDQAANVIVGAFDRAATAADTLAAHLAGNDGAGTGGAAPARSSDAALMDTVVTQASGALDRILDRRGGKVVPPSGQGEEVTVVGRHQANVYADTIAGVLKKLGISDKTAADIGKGAGKALAGAFEGQAAAGVAGMLGIRTSNTGAAIGGAIGKFLPIPGGSIIGGLAGGVLGNLFNRGPRGASAVITSASDAAAVSGDKRQTGALSESAKAVQGTIQQIAQAFGTEVGAFAVSIGQGRGKNFRVSSTGSTQVSARTPKNASLIYDGPDEATAVGYAIRDAISDGAIAGISGKVKQGLLSSTDINKAIAEGLKVQAVETSLKGFSGVVEKAFRDLEAQAKDRVRIARQYGFDVLAIERKNAEDRAKLAEQMVKSQAGSLQSLVEQLTSGSLFEGNAMEKIAALNTSIEKAKADLAANKEGAADTLASLYEQRLAASKAAYATTGGYAADRSATIAEAQAAIARVNAQVTAAQAQAQSDPALVETNKALDENNDQNARIIAAVEENSALLRQLVGSAAGTSSFNLSRLAAF